VATESGPGALAGAAGTGGNQVCVDALPDITPARRLQTAGGAALHYTRRGWPVFPCQWAGDSRKRPLIERGLHAATVDQAQIRHWWSRWPHALIGTPTGKAMGSVVLDVDVKRPEANGFDTLADLGHSILPDTPMAHTASGGLHVYFRLPDHLQIRNTAGERGAGIGPGLDWRGEGGFVILPSPNSGYSWDSHWNIDTVALAAIPITLLPRTPERPAPIRPVRPAGGLSPYADAALDTACRRIIVAPAGEQELTLNGEAFSIGTFAGAGAVPSDFARRALIWAARQIPDYDHRHPWRAAEIEAKVNRAFGDGMRYPREARRA
jgi:putative DNA primase/helicase